MIDEIHLLYGALLLTIVMVWEFFTLASGLGAFKAFGRRPLANRPFIALSLAAFLPGGVFLLSLALVAEFVGKNGAVIPALVMATLGFGGRCAMRALRDWGSYEESEE